MITKGREDYKVPILQLDKFLNKVCINFNLVKLINFEK